MKLGSFLLSAIYAYPEELYNYPGLAIKYQAGITLFVIFDVQVSDGPGVSRTNSDVICDPW